MEIPDELLELLLDLARVLNPLDHVTPTNAEEERDAFLAGKEEPAFTYAQPGYNPAAYEEKIGSLKRYALPAPFDALIAGYHKEFLLRHKLIQNVGKHEKVLAASSGLYGVPSKELVADAERLLAETRPVEEERSLAGEALHAAFTAALASYGLADWRVAYAEKQTTTVNPATKTITLNKERLFSEREIARLVAHEVGVHVLRAANGYAQPITFFAFGLPGYYATEEGLALYAEEASGLASPNGARRRAGHVLAADAIHAGKTFRETYALLRERGLDEASAWRVTLRTYRGGGFVKDHLYLDGYRRVTRYAEKGNLHLLYVGKAGLDDLPLVEQLLQDGALRQPAYLPRFL